MYAPCTCHAGGESARTLSSDKQKRFFLAHGDLVYFPWLSGLFGSLSNIILLGCWALVWRLGGKICYGRRRACVGGGRSELAQSENAEREKARGLSSSAVRPWLRLASNSSQGQGLSAAIIRIRAGLTFHAGTSECLTFYSSFFSRCSSTASHNQQLTLPQLRPSPKSERKKEKNLAPPLIRYTNTVRNPLLTRNAVDILWIS
ncbi:hypothetical protein DFP73DRAFT_257434 [Morchella snyderi]|nr:hypothetical protein DFP73DRAFT_257434 [Morchella snyderi]